MYHTQFLVGVLKHQSWVLNAFIMYCIITILKTSCCVAPQIVFAGQTCGISTPSLNYTKTAGIAITLGSAAPLPLVSAALLK